MGVVPNRMNGSERRLVHADGPYTPAFREASMFAHSSDTPLSDQLEEWRPVSGYEGVYSVSSLGNIRRDAGGQGARRGHILRATVMKSNGYLRVALVVNGKQITRTVHSLVLEAFVGPFPDGMECCHGDGDRTNACLSNLSWATSKENNADKAKHGTLLFGEACPSAKLTEHGVRLARQLLTAGKSRSWVARHLGVSRQTINDIVWRRSWRRVQ